MTTCTRPSRRRGGCSARRDRGATRARPLERHGRISQHDGDASVSCANCEQKLDEAVKAGAGKSTLRDLDLETLMLRNDFAWAGGQDADRLDRRAGCAGADRGSASQEEVKASAVRPVPRRTVGTASPMSASDPRPIAARRLGPQRRGRSGLSSSTATANSHHRAGEPVGEHVDRRQHRVRAAQPIRERLDDLHEQHGRGVRIVGDQLAQGIVGQAE